ncbi:pre-toxin TG domain-containing protein [Metasolibacillus meyeri]|uniref:Pre-toxin TG domain-containing protein n=1 Tax=Metasolibacillus meyeri TaxID=1071052 RepID=A0AAW9NR53_9BACL|nr:pre-toxin TG domain-containing protein [Metasolibacillus meyeri]MEC1180060.1 pre-toxin TG domain-containing protein [Metasolibacillus meyeri]
MGLDFLPIVGNIKASYESAYGKDPITGRKLSTAERAIAGAAILGGPLVKGAKHLGKGALKIIPGSDKLVQGVSKSFTKVKEGGKQIIDKVAVKAKELKAEANVMMAKAKQGIQEQMDHLGGLLGRNDPIPATAGGPPVKNVPVRDRDSTVQRSTTNVPEGYTQDANGRWHRPSGGYASNKEVGLPEPSGRTSRLEYMGSTPGKNSKTGKEVIERMENEIPPKIRKTRDGETEFMASDNKWYPIEEADMAHLTDAVSWWNSTGRYYGAKSPEVREWMLDSNNYVLDHYSLNRSAGAKLNETYLPPYK